MTIYDAAPYGIAIPKTAGTTKDAILGAVKALIADGTYKAILDKWGVAGGRDHRPGDQRRRRAEPARP